MRDSVSKASKLAGAASVLTLASLMASNPAQAASTSISDAFQHIIDCANWMITDPAKHAANCDPGHTVFVSSSTGSGDPEHWPG